MKPRSLEILRGKMKEKDKEIIRLLNERSQISVQIGKVKGEGGIQVYDPYSGSKSVQLFAGVKFGASQACGSKGDFPGNCFCVSRFAAANDNRFSGAGSHIFSFGVGPLGAPPNFFPRME